MTLEKPRLLREKSVRVFHHPYEMPESDGGPSSSATAAVKAKSPFVEKRREARYVTCEAVDVCILDVESQRLQGILRDVSRSGLRIELSLPVNAGARLEVLLHNRAIIFGEARYCQGSAPTYQVGVVIEDVYYPKNGPAVFTFSDRRNFPAPSGADSVQTPSLGRHDRAQAVFNQRQSLRCPIAQRLTGSHASPDDVAAFLHHDLSETKTALIERHLAACEECCNLMQLILANYTLFVGRHDNE
jgi:PilZ domain